MHGHHMHADLPACRYHIRYLGILFLCQRCTLRKHGVAEHPALSPDRLQHATMLPRETSGATLPCATSQQMAARPSPRPSAHAVVAQSLFNMRLSQPNAHSNMPFAVADTQCIQNMLGRLLYLWLLKPLDAAECVSRGLDAMLTSSPARCRRSPSVNRRRKKDPEAGATEGGDKAEADEPGDRGAAAEGKVNVKAEKRDGDGAAAAAAAADGKKEAATAIAAAEKAKKMTKRQREAAMSVSMPVRA